MENNFPSEVILLLEVPKVSFNQSEEVTNEKEEINFIAMEEISGGDKNTIYS